MTQIEIKEKIDANNRRIEEIFNPSIFELNSEIAELLQENTELRKHCLHQFDENGMCTYCYTKEES